MQVNKINIIAILAFLPILVLSNILAHSLNKKLERLNSLATSKEMVKISQESVSPIAAIHVETSGDHSPAVIAGEDISINYDNKNEKIELSIDEVRSLMERYQLFTKWEVNPSLMMNEGDVKYFYQEKLTIDRLKRKLRATMLVLQQAEKEGIKIPSKSILSSLAENFEDETEINVNSAY